MGVEVVFDPPCLEIAVPREFPVEGTFTGLMALNLLSGTFR